MVHNGLQTHTLCSVSAFKQSYKNINNSFLLLKGLSIIHMARPRRAISSASNSRARGPVFDTLSSHRALTFVSPSTDTRRAVISYWQKKVHLVLVHHLGGQSLPRNSLVRLTDRPDMTIGVYHGRKPTKRQTTTTLFIQTDTEWTHSLVSVFVVQNWIEDPHHLLWLHMKGYTIRGKGKQLCHFFSFASSWAA